MDCDNARLFLPFLRPGGKDLDGQEEAELRAHLEQCSGCNAQAMNAARLDQHLGRAMRAVEVPVGMKGRLLERLEEDRGVIRRKWLKRAGFMAGVAAMLLFSVWGYAIWSEARKATIDPQKVAMHASVGGRPVPDFANPDFLVGEPTLTALPGTEIKKARQYVFVRSPAQRAGPNNEIQVAIVYAVARNQYKEVLPAGPMDPGYPYQVAVRTDDEAAYVILYNGRDYAWLLAPEK